MKKCINSLLLALALLSTACDDNYNDALDNPGEFVHNDYEHDPSALDEWLQDNFTSPFNIEVKYRWDASELNLNRTLVPPAPDKVREVMDVARKVWIDPYVELAGGNFIKEYCPKQFVLVGSASYNLDGTIQLGTAEGGRKVVLYVVNDFAKDDRTAVEQMIHTVEHEFAHILHQNIMYPVQFKEISPGDYTANWHLISDNDARARGFITSYAMSSPNEDFVEMISMMLVKGNAGYEAILECETNAASRKLLRQKEREVVNYFNDAYGIDFYELQARVQEAINDIAPPDDTGVPPALDPLLDQWGFGKENQTIQYDLNVVPQQNAFIDRYTYDRTILRNAGYALDPNFKLHFTSDFELTLTLYYYEIDAANRVFQEANFMLNPQRLEGDTLRLSYWGNSDANGSYLEYDLKAVALLGYFANYMYYVADWKESCNGEKYARIYPTEEPENYALGRLSN